MSKRKPPRDIDDLSIPDKKAIWKSIAKHLPKIATETRLLALACSKAGLEPTFENMQQLDRQLRELES